MTKIVGTILTFVLSTFVHFNISELPQNEDIDDTLFTIKSFIDIQESNFYEEIVPQKVKMNVRKDSIESNNNWWSYPETIKGCTRDGDDLLVLVNKEYKLPSTYIPPDLVTVGESVIRRGSNYQLRSIVTDDLKSLVTDAQSEDIDLSIVSAYRSYSTQASTYQYWVNYNNGCVSCADKISARAGHSQHQLGTTLDFSSNEINDTLGAKFGDTNANAWLKENAYRYGFVLSFPQGYESTTGYSYEPWHYRYIGKENALEMRDSGMILEEYLRSKN